MFEPRDDCGQQGFDEHNAFSGVLDARSDVYIVDDTLFIAHPVNSSFGVFSLDG